jgi:hypothetical protein
VASGPAANDAITCIVRANVLAPRIDPDKRPEACLVLRLWVTTFRVLERRVPRCGVRVHVAVATKGTCPGNG